MKLSNKIYANNKTGQIEIKNLNNDMNNDMNNGWFARYGYPLGLITLIFIVLLLIEYKHPYFFLNDDNRNYFLPYYLHNYRSLLSGEIALYNFHQFLGTPHLALGQSAVLYPVVYLSVFISDFLLGHYFGTIDIMVIIHLLIAAVGMNAFLRHLNIERRISFLGGLTWSLCSFVVYVSNSWVVVSAAAAYFPWMSLFSFLSFKTPSLRVTICAVAVRLLHLYAGHIQYFIYSVIFEFLTVMAYFLSESKTNFKIKNLLKFLKKYIGGYVYVLIFSLPLLLPMWHQTTISSARSTKISFESFISLLYPLNELGYGIFYPFEYGKYEHVSTFGNFANLSHIGYIPIYFLLLGLIKKVYAKWKKNDDKSFRIYVFAIPAFTALIWSTSEMFNCIIYIIPILNRFRWPFKIAFYFQFYLVVISMVIMSNVVNDYSWRITTKKNILNFMVGLQMFNFLFLYLFCPSSFGYQSDSIPLEEEFLDDLGNGRIISIGFDVWNSPQFEYLDRLTTPTLGFNYATLWGLDHLSGYEPLISKESFEASLGLNFKAIIDSNVQIPVEHLRKAAVRWYVTPKTKEDYYSITLSKYGIIKKYEDENRVVYYDAKAYPMAFNIMGEDITNDNYFVTTNTINLKIEIEKSNDVIFNYLYNPFFEGFIDGEKVEINPIDDIHFSIFVPEGKHHILIKYRDPYFILGLYIIIIFLVFKISFRLIKIFY